MSRRETERARTHRQHVASRFNLRERYTPQTPQQREQARELPRLSTQGNSEGSWLLGTAKK